MPLQLKFNAEIKCCGSSKLVITDITSLYSQQNLGGWGCPNINFDDVEEAKFTLTHSNGNDEYDVTEELQNINDYTGSYEFDDIELDSYSDGIIEVQFSVLANTVTYSNTVKFLALCNIRKCIDKLWIDLANASCDDKCNVMDYIEDAELAESLYQALLSAGACYDENVINNLLSKLNKLCGNNCTGNTSDCGCGGN
jgi:hypothetical protein